MATITWLDKIDGLDLANPRKNVNAADMNEIKSVVNANQAALSGAIQAAVDDLVDGAPGALNTLNELAAALGDDANFAATVATALAGKQATLVSGTNIKTINGASLLGSTNIQLATESYADAKVANDLIASTVVAPSKAAVNTGLALRLLIANIVFNETPTGTKNGVNTAFTIANTVVTGLIMVFADGICVNTSGFNLTGTALTLTIPPDNSLTVTYIKA